MKIFIIDIDGTICENIPNELGAERMRHARPYNDSIKAINSLYEEGNYVCLPPDELVLTSTGLRPINEIAVGDLVYTHAGRFKKVLRSFSRQYKGDVIEVFTWNNFSPIRLTPEHPMLTSHMIPAYGRHGRVSLDLLSWTEAKMVGNDCFTAFAVPQEVEDVKEITALRQATYINRWGREEKQTWKRVFPVDTDFMTIVGYYLAEGTKQVTKQRTGHVCLCFGKSLRESQYAHEATICARRLGLNSRIDVTKYGHRVTIFSTPLMAFLEENFGYGSRNKRLPLWAIRLPNNKLEPMMDAYMKGDGCQVPKRTPNSEPRILVASVSRNLIEQMRLVCLKLGYQAYVHTMRKTDVILGRKVNSAQPYILYCVEPQSRVRSKGGWLDGEHQYLRIKEIRRTPYDGTVYNLEVEDDNSYSVSGGALHNCFFTARTDEHDEATRDWLAKHGVKYHRLILNKPRKLPPFTEYHFIDDAHVKATTFKGKFTKLVKKNVEIEVFEE